MVGLLFWPLKYARLVSIKRWRWEECICWLARVGQQINSADEEGYVVGAEVR